VRKLTLVVKRKFRSFKLRQHRADTATNSQTAAMLGVNRNAAAARVSATIFFILSPKVTSPRFSAVVQSLA